MKRFALLACGAALLLSGCYSYQDGYYGGSGGYYDGYYDGYYGPYVGGYWSSDGYFYYSDQQHRYHRDDARHFRHERFNGGKPFHGDRDRDRGSDRGDHRGGPGDDRH